ncbi:MAG TPA: hypothetical protein VN861_02730 [Candidatus Acidoferrales bacterium]|nr:hypothetical protein [Candidatus Acidoferrales bacterium]
MKRGTLLVVLVALCVSGIAGCGGGSIFQPGVKGSDFTFYAIGEDQSAPVYCIAGVVSIANNASKDGTFKVTGGVQDYNNGDTIISPQPSGDTITGGNLSIGSNGTAILTIITNNAAVGVDGTETFIAVFPNSNHALITQFDGSATSSGSIDLQTSKATPSGSFAFTSAGAFSTDGESFAPAAFGGVFTVASGSVSGSVDANIGGTVNRDVAITGVTFTKPNRFGRGTVNGLTSTQSNINYYVVGPEVVRFIDVDSATFDTAVGSAYGQGPNPNFSSGTIGQSVFSFSNAFTGYAAAGQIFTFEDEGTAKPAAKGPVVRDGAPVCSGTSTCLLDAVGDLNELFAENPVQLVQTEFEGSFQVPSNGFGTMTFEEGFGDTANFGIYAVDPTLNILDPNDTTDTLGGALIAEMDDTLIGTGSIVPQSDIVVADFSGNYAGGGQGVSVQFSADEFDFLTLATVTEPGGGFTGLVGVSDPFEVLTDSVILTTDASFTGNAVPSQIAGRYDLNPLALSAPEFDTINMAVGVYQASGQQLFWVETDSNTYFGGSLEQFPGTGGADAKKAKPNATKWQH